MCPASAASQIRLARFTVDPNMSSLWSTGSPAAMPIRTQRSGVAPAAIRASNPSWIAAAQFEGAGDIVERRHDPVAGVLHLASREATRERRIIRWC